ncbi:MAG: amidohydrolase [Bacteroidales bacterium]
MDVNQKIHNSISKENLITTRRDFHQYPEPGWVEFRTASIIATKLRDLGFTIQTGKSIMEEKDRMGIPNSEELSTHWQRALLQGGNPEFMEAMKGGFTAVGASLYCGDGPIIAMRFDMDALEIEEASEDNHLPSQKKFRSKNKRFMHCCGHDGHSAIGLEIAKVISEIKEHLKGTIKLIFQPAEEGVRGAKCISTGKFLDDVDYIYACHFWSQMPLKSIVCGMNGTMATSKFDAIFHGAPAHAGIEPEKGNNALLAAATATLNLHALPSFKGNCSLNVGKLISGTGRNIVPPKAILSFETRGTNTKYDILIQERAFQILHTSATMQNCQLEVTPMGSAKSVECNPEIIQIIKKCSEEIDFFETITPSDKENRGSEDFTFMMEKVKANKGKACFIGIGANINNQGHHTRQFDFAEEVMAPTVELFVKIAVEIMK